MFIKDVASLPAEERFLYWILERHTIWEKRQRGEPSPWTDDAVLQTVFFTNPYRENDKTTVWFRENVRGPLRTSPEVVMATIIFRWFNYIPTGETVLVPEGLLEAWNTNKAKRRLHTFKQQHGRVFTGAFNISNSGSTKSKIDRVCEDHIAPMWRGRKHLLTCIEQAATMQQAHKCLRGYLGMGGSGFMAYEVVCDLRYTYLLELATDKKTWSNPGPGAKRGLNRVLGRPLGQSVAADWPEQSVKLLKLAQNRLKTMPELEMREIEHSLCEFDKYERVRLGEGQSKRKYYGCA